MNALIEWAKELALWAAFLFAAWVLWMIVT